jgi:L-amino acid N-acyltransferase YncA
MFTTRLIEPTDCAAVLAVYKPYVEKTAYTFEYVVPTMEEFADKIQMITGKYPWLVGEYKGKIIGYAYGSTHRARTAYQWSPEATIYVSEEFHGSGIARILYKTLFDLLRMQGFYNVYAGVLMSNDKSVGFHKAMGFYEVGIFKHIGYKLGAWHDNLWLQLHLAEHIHEPAFPKAFPEIEDSVEVADVIANANRALAVYCDVKM